MVKVSFTETYDLSTKTNKMTLIGIHTPTRGIFERLYPGFLMQYAKCKILSQDVQIACASMLPADPLQVGVTAGDIAPEDLFNPILYKAASNESWSTLEARINGFVQGHASAEETGIAVAGFSAHTSNEHSTGLNDEFGVYYSLLSDRRGWKVANPQAGLRMSRLRPLVFERWYNTGVNGPLSDASARGLGYDTYGDVTGVMGKNVRVDTMRGSAHPMPAFNTTCITYPEVNSVDSGNLVANGMDQHTPVDGTYPSGKPDNTQVSMPALPKVMTACIVVPPSRLHQLYYRMTVTTHIEFFEPRSMVDVTDFNEMTSRVYPAIYFSDYSFSSKLLTNETSSVDVSEDATIDKIMESDH